MTLGESMIVIGIMIPATALLLFTGGLVGSGTLPVTPILLWGILGAIVGDAVSFWLGRWIGPTILRWRLLKRHRGTVARARLFFYRYGFLSIFFGRFLGPIRSTIPTVAGVMGMGQWRFQLANTLSAIVWVPLMLLPGFLAAKSVEAAKTANNLTLYIGGGLSVVVGIWLLYMFTKTRGSANVRQQKRLNRHGHPRHAQQPSEEKSP
ncbi:MAG: DedA family protein [Burkholderiaceae bacterium]|nr:DedA family protein [Burkholderiaceae bacterium]